jgi:hypothetical protein
MGQRAGARADPRLGRHLARAADDDGTGGPLRSQLDLGGEYGQQPGEVAPAASRGSMPTLSSSGCSPRTPRLRRASRQIRLVTVVSQPRRSPMPPPVLASRSHASWTASSASVCEPSMRNAIAWR